MTVAKDTTLTVDLLRSCYPNPTSMVPGDPPEGGYCVGGALVLFMGRARETNQELPGFPGLDTLEQTLMQANPKLPQNTANRCAREIIGMNDAGAFSAAWTFLGEALRCRG